MSSELLGVFADEDDGVFVDEAKDFICVDVVSSARQMSRALSRVRSGFFSSLDRVRSLKTPQTIRSLIKLSVRVPNSHLP